MNYDPTSLSTILALPASPLTKKEADELTRIYTAFREFDALVFAKDGYRPTFKCTPSTHCRDTKTEKDRCSDRVNLANVYDFAQRVLSDERRAYRY